MDKVKTLFLAAYPDASPLKLDEEIREITQKIRASEYRDTLELISAWAVRPDDLLQKLNEHKPFIVHFSGHGSQSGEIILIDENLVNGNRVPKAVSPTAMKALFQALKGNVRVVLLNACYSQIQAEAIRDVIDCVIGMNAAIGDQAAITFAASFYRALGFGSSVREAFEQGKVALLLAGIPEEKTPELIHRSDVDPAKIFLVGSNSDLAIETNVLSKEKREAIQPIKVFYGHSARVNTINISDDDSLIVSGGSDKKAYVWDVKSGKFVATLRHKKWVASVALTKNLLISSDGAGNIYVWDFVKQECLVQKPGHTGTCRTISLSPDRSWIATGGNDGDIHLWELPALVLFNTLKGHTSEVRRLSVNPKIRQMISGDATGHVYLWDLETSSYCCIYENSLETVRSVTYSRNGELVAISFSSGAILIWDIKNNMEKWHIESAHLGHAVGLSFHPTKSLIASGGADGFIKLWDFQKRDRVGKFHAHDNQINGVIFSSDGKWLISGSRDKLVCLWDTEQLVEE